MKGRRISVLLAVLFMANYGVAHADYTYNYIGNSFTSIQNPELGNNITASVTFDNNIGPTYTGLVSGMDIIFDQITSGDLTISSSNRLLSSSFDLNNGTIDSWSMNVVISQGTQTIFLNSSNNPALQTSEDSVSYTGGLSILSNGTNLNNNNPGTWTNGASAAPIPGAVWLLGSGLAVMGFKRKYLG